MGMSTVRYRALCLLLMAVALAGCDGRPLHGTAWRYGMVNDAGGAPYPHADKLFTSKAATFDVEASCPNEPLTGGGKIFLLSFDLIAKDAHGAPLGVTGTKGDMPMVDVIYHGGIGRPVQFTALASNRITFSDYHGRSSLNGVGGMPVPVFVRLKTADGNIVVLAIDGKDADFQKFLSRCVAYVDPTIGVSQG